MAIHKLSETDHQEARARKERIFNAAYQGLCNLALRAIAIAHMDHLEGNEVKLLQYLLNRTLRFNKIGQHLSASAFDKPFYGRRGRIRTEDIEVVGNFPPDAADLDPEERILYAAPLGMSAKARERATKNLAEKGYLQVFQCARLGASLAPIYEIDCKALLGYAVKDEETDMPLREPKTKKAQERAEKTHPTKGGTLPPGRGDNTSDLIQGKSKSSISSARSAPAEGRLSAREKAEQILAASKAQRAARAASAQAKPVAQITHKEMQSLVDKVMADHYPDRPRQVVTARDHAWFRKRLKEQSPPDLYAFLAYVATAWPTIVAQHNKALTRRRRDGVADPQATAMRAAFDFREMVTRYPYFLKAFTSARLHQVNAPAADAEATELAHTRKRLQQVTRELQGTQQALARQRRPVAPSEARTAPSRPARTSRPSAAPARKGYTTHEEAVAALEAFLQAEKRP